MFSKYCPLKSLTWSDYDWFLIYYWHLWYLWWFLILLFFQEFYQIRIDLAISHNDINKVLISNWIRTIYFLVCWSHTLIKYLILFGRFLMWFDTSHLLLIQKHQLLVHLFTRKSLIMLNWITDQCSKPVSLSYMEHVLVNFHVTSINLLGVDLQSASTICLWHQLGACSVPALYIYGSDIKKLQWPCFDWEGFHALSGHFSILHFFQSLWPSYQASINHTDLYPIFTTVKGEELLYFANIDMARALDEGLSDLTDSDASDFQFDNYSDKDYIIYSMVKEVCILNGEESEVLLPHCCYYAQVRDF